MKAKKNVEREHLRSFLKQYISATAERDRLEQQKRSIERDYLKNGEIVGVSMVIADVQKQIDRQIRHNAKLLVQIKDILNYLPDTCIQRQILDALYIDGKSWLQIERHFNYSEASVKRYAAAGLDELLKFERVKELIKSL